MSASSPAPFREGLSHHEFDVSSFITGEKHESNVIPGGSESSRTQLNDLAFMDASDDFIPALIQNI